MREIKFRGWHAPKKVMFSAEEMATDQLTLLPTGCFINVSGDNTRLSQIMPSDKFIPLQFTGLRDKNGKEIYEGDIVLIEDEYKERILDDGSGPIEPCNHLVPVIFQDGSFGVNIIHPALGLVSRGFWSFRDINDELGLTEFEVIGNIYENPELLEKPE